MSTAIASTYRFLVRSANVAFAGDASALRAAREQIRLGFRNDQYKDANELQEKLNYARDIGLILRQNVVQGVQDEEDPNKYQLKIHEETELGDNDDIKKKQPTSTLGEPTSFKGCCRN